MIVYNTNSYPLECKIDNLTNGQLYYVRVASGNHRGFSEARPSTPICLSPSSWRQVDGNKRRKYDEEVFRKFTKLILLNKHILDDHQVSAPSGQRAGQQHVAGGSAKGGGKSSGGVSKLASISSQNKSSLINMLLLDATMPSNEQLKHEFQLAAEASQRGSLYPSASDRESMQQFQQQQQQQLQQQQSNNSLSVRKNLKNFFQSNSFKFHKLNNQNKRGLYLTTVIYHSTTNNNSASTQSARTSNSVLPSSHSSDKILVTNDDRLPIIEVFNDLVSPGALMSDFYWLLKINGTQWMDIKRLRQQLQKSHSSSTLHLRIKLLTAIEQMQVALNMEDIGRLFYKPIQAHDGSIIICTCKFVANTKLVSNLSIKWTHQHKIIPRHLRKISDSMLNNQQQKESQTATSNQQQQQQLRNSKKDRTDSLMVGATILPASTVNLAQSGVGLGAASTVNLCGGGEGQVSSISSGQSSVLSASGVYSSANSKWVDLGCGMEATMPQSMRQQQQLTGGEFRLCDHCQYALVQRRSTMASGSSSSSLASSTDSQWSSGSTMAARCTCNRSNSSTAAVSANTVPPTNSSQALVSSSGGGGCCLLAATGSSGGAQGTGGPASSGSFSSASYQQRHSSSARSGSMMSSTPTRHSSMSSSRQSQSQQFSAAQKSSNYLMLASLTLYDLLLFTLNQIIDFDRNSTIPLSRGLYLGLVQLQTTVESMRLLVPRSRPNMVPCARIRDNAHVSKEEWLLLKRFASLSAPPMHCASFNPSNPPPNAQNPPNQSAGNCQAAADSCNSRATRISDPALWSAAAAAAAVADSGEQQCQGACDATTKRANHFAAHDFPLPTETSSSTSNHLQAGLNSMIESSVGGFDRNRAKSVSPGLMHENQNQQPLQQHLEQQQQRDSLSVSSDQISTRAKTSPRSNKVLTPDQHSTTSTTGTHSDTDLTTDRQLRQSRYSKPNVAKSSNNHLVCGLAGEAAASDPSLAGSAEDPQPNEQLCSIGNKTPESPSTALKQASNGETQTTRGICHSPTAMSRLTVNSATSFTQSPEEIFVRLVGSAARRLLAELKSQLPMIYDEQTDEMVSILQSLNDEENNRIYHVELIELSSQVTFILLIPSAENVCPVTSQEKANILADNKEYMLLPLQIFETIHIGTYEPDLLGKYSRLSAILETDLIVAQHDHRQAFSSNELKSTKSRVSHLQDMVSIADEFWRQLRWIVDVVSFARDKSTSVSNAGIKLGTIWRYFELSPSASYDQSINNNSISLMSGYQQQAGRFVNRSDLSSKAQNDSCNVTGSGDSTMATRTGYEVKRTISARARDEQSALEMSLDGEKSGSLGAVLMDSVPEIHLTHSSGSQHYNKTTPSANKSDTLLCQQPGGAKSFQRKIATDSTIVVGGQQLSSGYSLAQGRQVRRHSGDTPTTSPAVAVSGHNNTKGVRVCLPPEAAVPAKTTVTSHDDDNRFGSKRVQCTIFTDTQIEVKEIRDDADPDDSDQQVLDFSLGGSGAGADDEDAIYAYHISLKDATRAAAHRKSSQQSTRVMVCGYPASTADEPPTTPISSSGMGGAWATSTITSTTMEDFSTQQQQQQQRLITTQACNYQDSNAMEDIFNLDSPSHLAGNLASASTRPQPAENSGYKQPLRLASDRAGEINMRNRDPSTSHKRQMKSTNPFLSDSFDFGPN